MKDEFDAGMVSIIIPTFNRGSTIKESIQSVLTQTYTNFELIIVDDGSTDNTREVVLSIDDNRIRYIYQNNSGACAARNNGIDNSVGAFIAFHDSDDIWHEDKLEKQMCVFNNSVADIVFCGLNRYEKGKSVQLVPQNMQKGILSPVQDLFGIGTQTLVFKRDVLNHIRFDEKMLRFQEFELLINSTEKGYKIFCLDEGLVDYYIGDDSISKNYERLLSASRRIIEKYPFFCKKYPKMKKTMAAVLFDAAISVCERGELSYKQYLIMSAKYQKNIKNIMKVIFSYIGLYKPKRKG
ncbi:MAG: glycosyltransferase [Lachnospiraceae bacterium]|nr:glycosyltransferase [Lachnospiraceae bacterium]